MITGRNLQNLSQHSINAANGLSGGGALAIHKPTSLEAASHRPRQASMMSRQGSLDHSASLSGPSQNRFRKAQLQQSPLDVSSRYWQ